MLKKILIVALDPQGRIHLTYHEGIIVRLASDGTRSEDWADTKGRPLGIGLNGSGNLIVAYAYWGLLSVSPEGKVTDIGRG